MDPENTKVKTIKLRIIPNKQQKLFFNKCFGVYRYYYNLAVKEINNRYDNRMNEFKQSTTCVLCSEDKVDDSFVCKKHSKNKLPWKLDIKLQSIRDAILVPDRDNDIEWQKEIPYDVRQLAIQDAIFAYKSAIALKSNGHIEKFTLGYKSRNSTTKIFSVTHKSLKTGWKLFPTRLKKHAKIQFKKRECKKLPDVKNVKDFKIMNDHGKLYVLLPVENNTIPYTPANKTVLALDPGIRVFQTGYDPSGVTMNIGDSLKEIINPLYDRIDKLKSIKSKKHKKYNIKKRIRTIQKRIKNIICNLHNQTTSLLTKEYENIILPEFGTSKMLAGNTLHSSVKRMMGTLSFYRFKQKLRYEAHKRKRNLYIVTEEFTSKTCTSCGKINNNLGSNRIFECAECGLKINRDINGSRNILIKHTII